MYHILHDIEIHGFRDEIFAALTKPELLNKWWTVKAEGRPEVNAEYRFYFSDEYDWKAKILEVHPPASVSYQMTRADNDWTNSILSFEIIEIDHLRQNLRFEHRNWRSVNDHFRKTSYCWALYLNAMKKLVEKSFHEAQQS